MADLFNKLASLSEFAREDFREFFQLAEELSSSEVACVLGYLLGRFDAHDAANMVSVLRELHPQYDVKISDGRRTVNLVGTGGGPPTFNITTIVAFVVAAAGVVVIKTGSSACRSSAGFADVAMKLKTLKLSMPWERIEEIANDIGIVFVPPGHHAPELGILEYKLSRPAYRNVALYFNKLGPLLSPVHVDHRFIGVHTNRCLETLSDACDLLDDTPTTLISAKDGMDEVSSMSKTKVVRLRADHTRQEEWIDPAEFDLHSTSLEALCGDEPAAAAECCERILAGEGTTDQSQIVALNSSMVLTSLGRVPDLQAGYKESLQLIQQGAGLNKLRELREQVWKCPTR